MNTLKLKIIMGCWLVLGLLGIGMQLAFAAIGEMEYHFERMIPHEEYSIHVSSPGGIAVSPDSSIWVVDSGNYRLQHFHVDGTLINVIGKENFVYLSGDIAIAKDGSVWVTEWGTSYSRFQHFDSEGKRIGQFSVGNILTTAIAIAADGSLWVDDNKNHRLQHYTSEGTLISQFGSVGTESGQFSDIKTIKVATDGSLWVSDNFLLGNVFGGHYVGRIQHFQANGEYIEQVVHSDGVVNGIAIATDGSLWVLGSNHSDGNNDCIRHFQANGNLIRQFCSAEGTTPFVFLRFITIAEDGSLWVTARGDGPFYGGVDGSRIMHFQPDGTLISPFSNGINDSTWLKGKIGISVNSNGEVWATDASKNRILHFDATGSFIGQLGHKGAGAGEFSNPTGIAIAKDGSLWIVDSNNYRIQHLNTDGTFIQQFQTPHSIDSYGAPAGIVVAIDGSIWVTLPELNQILHYQANGTLLKQFETYDQGGCNFCAPSSIAEAADGTIWVTQKYHGNIQHYQADGAFISQFGSKGDAPGQFSYPIGITVAANGTLWVADSGNYRLQNLDTNGAFISELGLLGGGAGQFNAPVDVALAPDGALWVKDSNVAVYNGRYDKIIGKHNRLQKFSPRIKSATNHPYKAIILAGGAKKLGNFGNQLWDSTWQVSQKAQKALHFQGFKPHEETLFLTAGNTQLDLDDNGQLDDLQAATKDSLRQAIIDWAKDSTDVVLYLSGQANTGQFQVNATETFTAQELSGWLTELEKKLPANGKVTVVIEAPDAGSFMAVLANPTRPRYVIASTRYGQSALVADHGVNSFSYTFWSRIMDGASLADAFVAGQQAISPFIANDQALQPAGDANGNGQFDAQDAGAVGNYCLGMCNKTVNQLPVIQLSRQLSLTFKAANSLDFHVKIKPSLGTHLIDTWALVQRLAALKADPANLLNLEKIPLSCDAMQNCTASYANFDTPGQYRLYFYALDSQYQLNTPAFLDINIQPENTSTVPVEYDSRQGLLTIRDVEVNNQHYQAVLQYQDGLYYLLTLGLTPDIISLFARFDKASNLLDIPLARVDGEDYQGSFKLVDNYLFERLTASPR